jgi:hypothetical protein
MAKKLQSIGSKRAVGRKRKPKLRSQGFIFPRKVAVTLALALSVCMAYIYIHNTNKRLGRQIKVLEGERETAKYKALNQIYRWQDLTTAENLEKALVLHQLDMRLAEVSQVVEIESVDFWLERGVYAEDTIELARRRELR